MNKSDASIHKICLAAIIRHTIGTYDFQWTYLFQDVHLPDFGVFTGVQLEAEELPICACLRNEQIWTLLTTRRIISKEEESRYKQRIETVRGRLLGNFKRHGDLQLSKGEIVQKTGENRLTL